METQVRQALQDIRATRMRPPPRRQFLANLYSQLWAPLEPALVGIETILLSPDGMLNLVPFAALMDEEERFLVERYPLSYVTSGRDLVNFRESKGLHESELLLVANPDFGKDLPESSNGSRVSLGSSDMRMHFLPLEGTGREARAIPSLVPGKPDTKRVLVGVNASESAVKAARSPRILHLATHGFFLADQPFEFDPKHRDISVVGDQFGGVPGLGKIENPLIRSGLAFAGANHAGKQKDGEDGILTALEVTV